VWRLATWPLIEQGPLSLVLTLVAIYKFGGELAWRWGDRRLRRFIVEIVLAAAVVTCVIAALAGATYFHRVGGWAIGEALVIGWARQFPERTLVLYGFVKLNGPRLVWFVLAIAILYAIYIGPIAMMPELAACAIAAAYPSGLLRQA